MRFCVLGSGSSGNSTFVEHGGVRILVDAGFTKAQLEKRLSSIGESLATIDGIFVTHEHIDHVRGLEMVAEAACCPVWVTDVTREQIKWTANRYVECRRLSLEEPAVLGALTVSALRVPHDAAQPLALRIESPTGALVVVTDIGEIKDDMVDFCRGASALILESNHDTALLDAAPYPEATKSRIRSNRGHLSNGQLAAFLRDRWDGCASHIILTHLSTKANLPKEAERSARAALRSVGVEDLVNLVVSAQGSPTNMLELL